MPRLGENILYSTVIETLEHELSVSISYWYNIGWIVFEPVSKILKG